MVYPVVVHHKTNNMKVFKVILGLLLLGLMSFNTPLEYVKFSYDNTLKFEFDVPANWHINNENDGTGYFLNCNKINDSNPNVVDTNCSNGIVFKMKYFKNNLKNTLVARGLKQQGNVGTFKSYTTIGLDGKIKIAIANDIKSDSYKGLYYAYSNDFYCKQHKKKKYKGHIQCIYFSDGEQTICIETTRAYLPDDVFNHIIKSFKFNK